MTPHERKPAKDLPDRHHPVHGVRIASTGPTIVFVTACTKDLRPWLATDANHALLRSIWQSATAWRVGRYVLMPEHVHLFAAPGEAELMLEAWIRCWKSLFSRQCDSLTHRWQVDHWDRRLRSGESYTEKWEYVRENPVRHGLVQWADDWPFQGEIFELEW